MDLQEAGKIMDRLEACREDLLHKIDNSKF